jgi:hypothetical protein
MPCPSHSPWLDIFYFRLNCWMSFFRKIAVFWDIVLGSALKVSQLGGTRRFHLLGWGVGKKLAWLCLLSGSCWSLAWLTLQPLTFSRHIPPKRRLMFNGQHGVVSQKTEVFIIIVVIITYPPYCLFSNLPVHKIFTK